VLESVFEMAEGETETTTTAAPAPAAEEEKQKTSTLYIWGLDRTLLQETVKAEFEKFAKVNRVTIIKDKSTGASKGFGYVQCETPEDATKALKEVDGSVIGENPIRIKYSYSETPDWLKFLDSKGGLGERPPRGRGRGGRGFVRARGRGGFSVRGRGDYREGYGRYNDSWYDGKRDVGRGPPPGRHDYGRPPYDDPYARRPREEDIYGTRTTFDDGRRTVDDRIPYGDRLSERVPPHRVDDPYGRRPPRESIYAPPSGVYDDERPPRRAATDLYGSSKRDEIYSPAVVGRREAYEDRADLYRPSDRGGYARSAPDNPHLPPPDSYRSRSPIVDRPIAAERDPYERRPLPVRDPYNSTAHSGYRPSYESAGRPVSSYPERVPPMRGPPERNPDVYSDPYARVDA